MYPRANLGGVLLHSSLFYSFCIANPFFQLKDFFGTGSYLDSILGA